VNEEDMSKRMKMRMCIAGIVEGFSGDSWTGKEQNMGNRSK
jgi:hypothetical protein